MYLRIFKDNPIKKSIVDLCIYCAKANNEVLDEEIQQIKDFCEELVVEFFSEPLNALNKDLEIIRDGCTRSEQKKIVVELLAIMLSDGKCDAQEWDFLTNNIIPVFGIDEEELEKYYKALQQLYLQYGYLNSLVD